jgi:3-polyprenyl-4-hydroxybenzoate decarboxylase
LQLCQEHLQRACTTTTQGQVISEPAAGHMWHKPGDVTDKCQPRITTSLASVGLIVGLVPEWGGFSPLRV